MIKAIIFDLGGVILKHKATLVGDILAEIFSISPEVGMQIWDQYRVRLLSGELSSREFFQEIKQKLNSSYSVEEILAKEHELYSANAKIDQEMLEFVKELKVKYKVYLLTDTIDIHDQFNQSRGIYDHFDLTFRSCLEHTSKASGDEFFKKALEKINLVPEECIYIDDLEENIVTAEGLGMKAILYKNLQQLKEDLQRI